MEWTRRYPSRGRRLQTVPSLLISRARTAQDRPAKGTATAASAPGRSWRPGPGETADVDGADVESECTDTVKHSGHLAGADHNLEHSVGVDVRDEYVAGTVDCQSRRPAKPGDEFGPSGLRSRACSPCSSCCRRRRRCQPRRQRFRAVLRTRYVAGPIGWRCATPRHTRTATCKIVERTSAPITTPNEETVERH